MLSLDVVFFVFILFGDTNLECINLCFSLKLGNFQLLFRYFFLLHSLSSVHFELQLHIRAFVIVLQVLGAFYLKFSLYLLSVVLYLKACKFLYFYFIECISEFLSSDIFLSSNFFLLNTFYLSGENSYLSFILSVFSFTSWNTVMITILKTLVISTFASS